MRKPLFICLTLLAGPTLAQDRAGNDTPGDWRVTHHAIHDIWNTMCDERVEHGQMVRRCYIRRVDVFSPRPDFAAQFLFVTPAPDGFAVEFGMEAGTLFAPNGFRIEDMSGATWRSRKPGCLTGLACSFAGSAADTLLDAMRDGGNFRFTFRDRHGRAQDLTWSLARFPAAWQDFIAQSRQRDLLP